MSNNLKLSSNKPKFHPKVLTPDKFVYTDCELDGFDLVAIDAVHNRYTKRETHLKTVAQKVAEIQRDKYNYLKAWSKLRAEEMEDLNTSAYTIKQYNTIINKLVKSYVCRPEGVWTSLAPGQYMKFTTCDQYKICPWCFYRKFKEICDYINTFDGRISAVHYVVNRMFLRDIPKLKKYIRKRLKEVYGHDKYVFIVRILYSGDRPDLKGCKLCVTVIVPGKQAPHFNITPVGCVDFEGTVSERIITNMQKSKFIANELATLYYFEKKMYLEFIERESMSTEWRRDMLFKMELYLMGIKNLQEVMYGTNPNKVLPEH